MKRGILRTGLVGAAVLWVAGPAAAKYPLPPSPGGPSSRAPGSRRPSSSRGLRSSPRPPTTSWPSSFAGLGSANTWASPTATTRSRRTKPALGPGTRSGTSSSSRTLCPCRGRSEPSTDRWPKRQASPWSRTCTRTPRTGRSSTPTRTSNSSASGFPPPGGWPRVPPSTPGRPRAPLRGPHRGGRDARGRPDAAGSRRPASSRRPGHRRDPPEGLGRAGGRGRPPGPPPRGGPRRAAAGGALSGGGWRPERRREPRPGPTAQGPEANGVRPKGEGAGRALPPSPPSRSRPRGRRAPSPGSAGRPRGW